MHILKLSSPTGRGIRISGQSFLQHMSCTCLENTSTDITVKCFVLVLHVVIHVVLLLHSISAPGANYIQKNRVLVVVWQLPHSAV